MFSLRTILSIGLLTYIPFFAIQANDQISELAARAKGTCNDDARFKLKDLKGTYIALGFTAGGPSTSGSAFVFRIFDNHGNGEMIQDVVRAITSGSGTSAQAETLVFAGNKVKATLDSEGIGTYFLADFPVKGENFNAAMVVKKRDKNGKVTEGFLVATGISGSGPDVNGPIGNEIKVYTFTRQIDNE